jgi:hypothetical protein
MQATESVLANPSEKTRWAQTHSHHRQTSFAGSDVVVGHSHHHQTSFAGSDVVGGSQRHLPLAFSSVPYVLTLAFSSVPYVFQVVVLVHVQRLRHLTFHHKHRRPYHHLDVEDSVEMVNLAAAPLVETPSGASASDAWCNYTMQ